MKRLDSAHRRFLASLSSSRHARVSTTRALWRSRWAILQWFAVFAVFSLLFVQLYGVDYASNILAAGVGLMLGLFVQLRQSVRVWPWLAEVVDWVKVEKRLADCPDDGQ